MAIAPLGVTHRRQEKTHKGPAPPGPLGWCRIPAVSLTTQPRAFRATRSLHEGHAIAVLLLTSFAATATFAAPPKSQQQPPADAKQQLLALEKEWVAAETKHDGVTLRRILDNKFLATFGAGKPRDKETFIKELLSGPADPTESQKLTDETVIVDGDTAVVLGIDTLHGTEDGAPYTLVARYTTIYIFRRGQWLALAEHLVKVPDAK